MRGLATARALVVDDVPEEAGALLAALGMAGVGAIYLNGDFEKFPPEPLRGIRLTALDMFLTPVHDPTAAAGQVVSLLERVLAEDNGPYVAITWTTSGDASAAFRAAITGMTQAKRPLAVLELDKADVRHDGNFDHAQILERVQNAVNEFLALSIVAEWEQLVHEAASDPPVVCYQARKTGRKARQTAWRRSCVRMPLIASSMLSHWTREPWVLVFGGHCSRYTSTTLSSDRPIAHSTPAPC